MSRPRLLAYRALGLGDLLTGVPALRALRDAFPEHELILAAPAALAPLAALTGAVDRVARTAPLAPPPVDDIDVAVNLHGRGPQSHRAILCTLPRRLIAFGGSGPAWRPREHEVHRWCRLLGESGIPADPSRLDLDAPGTVPGAQGATVIHPGAASGARRWPVQRWAEVAEAERAAGRRVVVTGSAGERVLAARVARDAHENLAGRTDALELAAVVAHAGRVLCGDTGVAHLATAFGTPSVVLFGPTPPDEWGPPPERPRHVALHRGGRGDPHADTPDPGLLTISVQHVLDVAEDLASAARASRSVGCAPTASPSEISASRSNSSSARRESAERSAPARA